MNSVDIIIPFGRAYILENQNSVLPEDGELRYCLRSIDQHLQNVRNVYLVGMKLPTWVNDNVKTIYAVDQKGAHYAAKNIFMKLCAAAIDPQISDPFLYMNDDHFLCRDFDASRFPYYYQDTFAERTPPHARITSYRRTMNNTIAQIGAQAKYFDVHTPILMNKKILLNMRRYPWKLEGGQCIKSTYCHDAGIEGVPTIDRKVQSVQSAEWIAEQLEGREYFSTHDNCFGPSMIRHMNSLFPNPSKYETNAAAGTD